MTMKNFKGFDKNLRCRDFQYEIGKEYEEKNAIACKNGFHACKNPLDVFGYYPPCDGNRFCEVEQDGIISKHESDSKIASSKIKIGAEIGIFGLVKAFVEYTISKVDFKNNKKSNTGDKSAATNTGYRSAATNTGYRSAATNTGDKSAATNTGDQSAATNTGDRSAATNTGYQSAATNTGDRSAAEVNGKDSIAIVTGYNSCAKGALGCWIVLTERNDKYFIIHVEAFKVDGENVKPDTSYKLVDKKLVEVK